MTEDGEERQLHEIKSFNEKGWFLNAKQLEPALRTMKSNVYFL